MEIQIDQYGQQPEPVPKKRHLGCLISILLLLLALGICGYVFRGYLAIIPTIFEVTQKVVPRTKEEQQLTYQYGGNELVNILLLGSDNDTKFNPDNVLTQTIIIVSINTKTDTVNMISIPRDYWVPIEGVSGGYGKMDEASGLGGLALTRETIEKDFGIHIDFYAWVGLQGFVKVIDTFGGINIDVNHPVIDDIYPDDISGNNPYSAIRLYIPAGPQHLSGIQALEYVRSRHGDLLGDFGRSARQQQVLLTLEEKVKSTDLVSKAPSLIQALSGYVRTDMSIVDITKLAPLLSQIKSSNIHRYILDPPDYAKNGLSPDGTKDIVIPNFSAINKLFATVFNTSENAQSN